MSRSYIAGDCRPVIRVFLVVVLLLVVPLGAAGEDTVPFHSSFTGEFSLRFGAGPDGIDDLLFTGPGRARHMGKSTVAGHSTTLPDPTEPGCSDIVTDWVILTAANGDQLWLVNSGEDCLDFTIPNRLFIRGTGTFTVAGGTGRFAGATGSGDFKVDADVLSFDDDGGGVSGSFALSFTGQISRPHR